MRSEQEVKGAINACRDLLKSFFRRNVTLSLDEILEKPAEIEEENREVLEAVLSLPQKYRDVIYMHYYEDYTAPEISGILGKNVNTVYTLLTRSGQLLRENGNGNHTNENRSHHQEKESSHRGNGHGKNHEKNNRMICRASGKPAPVLIGGWSLSFVPLEGKRHPRSGGRGGSCRRGEAIPGGRRSRDSFPRWVGKNAGLGFGQELIRRR